MLLYSNSRSSKRGKGVIGFAHRLAYSPLNPLMEYFQHSRKYVKPLATRQTRTMLINVNTYVESRWKQKDMDLADNPSEFLLYTSPEGDIKVDVFFHNESIWLTQKRMAELFDVKVPTINEHLKNIFSSGELGENSVIREFLTTANDGKSITLSSIILTQSSQ